ncbi:expressed unknown protein [Seminavis robusta]|uniref:ABM domain-containing protein n=1 Tax=Seminavis robusta TaxID=568900 RepID=A0A9N8DMS8_9STRA|nr:expressed unknown protein [Seminavis robusta]|eukprot:Sro220_g090700.1 n/a (197) ;mRNA; f:28274-28864
MPQLFVVVSTHGAKAASETNASLGKDSLRMDVVKSNDDGRAVLVETTKADPTTNRTCLSSAGDSVTKWKVLFPEPNKLDKFTSPIRGDPLYFLVYFYIKQDCVHDFIDLLLEEAALVHELEKGCVRFDLWQSLDNPTDFVVLESVADWAAIEEHRAFPHYQKARAALENMQAKPRSHDKGYKVLHSVGANNLSTSN